MIILVCSWKNGSSTYIPAWAKRDRKTYFRCRTARRSKTACPGQPYWSLCDAEALVEKQLSRYAAAPEQLTQDQAAALLQSITVYPPQDGTRRIELQWSF